MNTMKNDCRIRLETPADYREVENLTREAFWNVYRPGCLEHYILHSYRGKPDFVPELVLCWKRTDDYRPCDVCPLGDSGRTMEGAFRL